MTSWNYGDAHKRVEFKNNRLDFEKGSLFVHDIMNELPKGMIFTPWKPSLSPQAKNVQS